MLLECSSGVWGWNCTERLKGVQRIIMEEDAGQNAAVLKHKFVIVCADACKNWTWMIKI